jgi:hypothetical protein
MLRSEIALPDSERFGLSESDLKSLPRGDPRTAAIADSFIEARPPRNAGTAERLQMKRVANVSQQLSRAKKVVFETRSNLLSARSGRLQCAPGTVPWEFSNGQ